MANPPQLLHRKRLKCLWFTVGVPTALLVPVMSTELVHIGLDQDKSDSVPELGHCIMVQSTLDKAMSEVGRLAVAHWLTILLALGAPLVPLGLMKVLEMLRCRRIRNLVKQLSSSRAGEKVTAAEKLRQLAYNPADGKRIVREGGIDPLVKLLKSNQSRTEAVKEAAAGALYNLSAHSEANRQMIVDAKAIGPLKKLLTSGTDAAKRRAAGTLRNLGFDVAHRQLIGEIGAVEPLVELLRSETDAVKQEAAAALRLLARDSSNSERIREAGGVSLVVGLLTSGNDEMKEQAAWALRHLAKESTKSKDLIANAETIGLLKDMLSDKSDAVQEAAAETLRFLAWKEDSSRNKQARKNKRLIAEAGAIPPLVALLKSLNDEVVEAAAGALQNLALDSEKNVQLIGNKGAIELLTNTLKSGSDAVKVKASGALCNLAVNHANRQRIQQAGAHKSLVELLESKDNAVAREAANAIRSLALYDPTTIAEAGAIRPLVKLLKSGRTDAVKIQAARALENLASHSDNRALIVDEGALKLLVRMLSARTDAAKEAAARAICNLALDPTIRRLIGEAGAIGTLVELLTEEEAGVQEAAAKALWFLAHDPTNKAVIRDAGAISLLQELVMSPNEAVKKAAAGALQTLLAGCEYPAPRQLTPDMTEDLQVLETDVGPDTEYVRIFLEVATSAAEFDPTKIAPVLVKVVEVVYKAIENRERFKEEAKGLKERLDVLKHFALRLDRMVKDAPHDQLLQHLVPSCRCVLSRLGAAKKLLTTVPSNDNQLPQFMQELAVARAFRIKIAALNAELDQATRDMVVCVGILTLHSISALVTVPEQLDSLTVAIASEGKAVTRVELLVYVVIFILMCMLACQLYTMHLVRTGEPGGWAKLTTF